MPAIQPNIKRQTLQPLLIAMLALTVSLGGCAEKHVKSDPTLIAKLREAWLLNAEPADALTPIEWREAQAEEPAVAASQQVVLVGKVGGIANPWPEIHPEFPWIPNESTFFLVDAKTASEALAHANAKSTEEIEAHAADCAFCARAASKQVTAVAAISFVDEEGNPTTVDIRELFELRKDETVVITGKASLVGNDLLKVEANGLFRRR